MYDDTSSLFSKKNIINLLLLGILILGIPLATNMIKYRQILTSRAGADPITFTGVNIKTVGANKYATSTKVDIELVAPDINPSSRHADYGLVTKAYASHCGSGRERTVYCASSTELWQDDPCGDDTDPTLHHSLHTDCAKIGQICDPDQRACASPPRDDKCPTVGDIVGNCDIDNNPGHTYCEYGSSGNTVSSCKVHTCIYGTTDGGTPNQDGSNCKPAPSNPACPTDGSCSANQVNCGSDISSKSGCEACSGKGTRCDSGTCQNNQCVISFVPILDPDTGSCTVTASGEAGSVQGSINDLVGRNRVYWKVLGTGNDPTNPQGVPVKQGATEGKTISFTGLNPGTYKLKADVYCDGDSCTYKSSKSCNPTDGASFTVSGATTYNFVCRSVDGKNKWVYPGNKQGAKCDNPSKSCPATGSGCCEGPESVFNSECGQKAAGEVTATKFKLALDQSSLEVAKDISYTATPTKVENFDLSPTDPSFRGSKTVFVRFTYSDDSQSPILQKSIEVIGSDPQVDSVSCLPDLSGGFVTATINGSDFGSRGENSKVTVADNNSKQAKILSWSNTQIVASIPNVDLSQPPPAIGTVIPLTLTRHTDGAKKQLQSECTVKVSQLLVNAALVCQSKLIKQIDGCEVVIAENKPGGQTFKETAVSVTKEGVLKGLKTKLQKGERYKVSLKCPGSIRKLYDVTGAEGTTIVKDLSLATGDINGDGCINAIDKTLLNQQWDLECKASSERSADLNKDGCVNSIDWVCQRKDFGQCDAEEPTATPPAPPPPPQPLSVSGTVPSGTNPTGATSIFAPAPPPPPPAF